MFRIYGLFTPMFVKPVYAAEELGVPYEIVPVNLLKGEQLSPEHLARHPFGKVPVLEHNGEFIFESNTIVRYMANVGPENAIYPSQPMARAKVDSWLEYFSHQAGRWTTAVWFEKCIAPKHFGQPENETKIAEFTAWLLQVMPTIDTQLAKQTYLTGPTFTLADLVAHILMGGFKEAQLPLGDFKNFIRWYEQVEARPAYQRARATCDRADASAR